MSKQDASIPMDPPESGADGQQPLKKHRTEVEDLPLEELRRQLTSGGSPPLHLAHDTEGQTWLYRATQKGHAKMVDLLLQHNVDPMLNGGWGPWGDCEPPLLAATREGHLDVVIRLLLHPEQSPDAADEQGRTAVWWACKAAQLDILLVLLKHGANPFICAIYRVAPMDICNYPDRPWAGFGDPPHIGDARAALDERYRKCRQLIENTKREWKSPCGGWKILSCEVLNSIMGAPGVTALCRRLEEHPELLYITFEDEETLLSHAARRGRADLLEVLLQRGAGARTLMAPQIDWCVHPLHEGARYGHVPVVEMLIEWCGPEILSLKDSEGKTALDYAVHCQHIDVVRALLRRGADPWCTAASAFNQAGVSSDARAVLRVRPTPPSIWFIHLTIIAWHGLLQDHMDKVKLQYLVFKYRAIHEGSPRFLANRTGPMPQVILKGDSALSGVLGMVMRTLSADLAVELMDMMSTRCAQKLWYRRQDEWQTMYSLLKV